MRRKGTYQSTQAAKPKYPGHSVLAQVRMMVCWIVVNVRVDRSEDRTSNKGHLIIMGARQLAQRYGKQSYTNEYAR